MCAPIKLNFLFYKKKNRFLMLFQTCSKFTFGLSDVFVVTVITRNRISGVGSLFFNDRILRFGKNLPQSLKRFFSNFNIVGIQNSANSQEFFFFDGVISVPNNRRKNSGEITRNCLSRRINKRSQWNFWFMTLK